MPDEDIINVVADVGLDATKVAAGDPVPEEDPKAGEVIEEAPGLSMKVIKGA
jgi:hypothetical protein